MIRGALASLLLATVLTPLAGEAYRLNERGNRLFAEGDLDGALGAYTEAQVYAPEAPELFFNIGNVLYEKGDAVGAAEAYRRALGGAPEHLLGDSAYNLGNALFAQQQFEDAVREYRRALEADPADPDAKRNLELALQAIQEQQQQQQQQGEQQQQDQQRQQDPQPQDRQQREQQQNDEQQSPGGEQEERQQAGQPPPQGLTEGQAQRMLDTLAEQERENLRREMLRRARGAQRGTEKDW